MNSLRACSDLYAHAEHTGQELTGTLSMRVRNWCVCWAYKSGTGACTEHTRQGANAWQSAVPSKHAEQRAYTSGTDAYPEHTGQELMCALSIRIRNSCARSACAPEIKWCLASPKIKVTSLYLSPKVTNPERLYGVKIMKIQAIENLTLGHL